MHCYECGRDLPLERFQRSAKRADGRHALCKECRKMRATYSRAPQACRTTRDRRIAQALDTVRQALDVGDARVIGPALRVLRRRRGLSLADVETISGWGKSLIAYMERGERWSEDALPDILAALEVK